MIKLLVNGSEVKFETTIFPDGTSQVWKVAEPLFEDDDIKILWMFESEAELFHVCQLAQLTQKLSHQEDSVLDSHIGLIYGDAITLRRAEEIMERLKAKGFASTNVVFGIGSYTYQYNTRDTFGYALKSTLCVIDGEEKPIFKDPKADNGVKKSQKGRVAVVKDGDSYRFIDGLKLNDAVAGDLLQEVFRDGKLLVDENFSDIRARIQKHYS